MADKRIYQLSNASSVTGQYLAIDKSGNSEAERYLVTNLISAVQSTDVTANTNWQTGYKAQFGDSNNLKIYYGSKGGTIENNWIYLDGNVTCASDVYLGSITAGSDWQGTAYCETQAAGDSSNKVASTAFVSGQSVPRGLVNGSFVEGFDALITSDGATITMSLEKSGGGDLTMQFSDGLTTLDCTPAQTIALTAGSVAIPQENFVYILQSTKALTKSTTSWPATEHIKVAYSYVQTAAYVASDGALVNQNWNDHLTESNNMGHLINMAERSRRLGAIYFSGIDPAGATASYYTTGAGSVTVQVGAGVIYQMHKHTYVAKDTSASDDIHVVNDNSQAFYETSNLYDITTDANGGTLNNKFFNTVMFGVANKTGEYSPLMILMPTGTYNLLANAENDVDGYDVYSIPREFNLESSTAFFICRTTWKKSGGTWVHQSTIDLRGTNPTSVSGAGGTGTVVNEYADSLFRIYDNADVTRLIAFSADGITTGNTRTLTAPDYDGTIATLAGTETLTNKTLTTPTIADFTNATHDHEDNAGGGTLGYAAIADLDTWTGSTAITTLGTIGTGVWNGTSIGSDYIVQAGVWNSAYNDVITSASFGTGDGVLTLTQRDSGTVTVDLDGRYTLSSDNYFSLSNNTIDPLYPLNISALRHEPDSGIVTIADMGVTYRSAYGDEQGFQFIIGGDVALKIYGTADGAGGLTGITLDVDGTAVGSGTVTEVTSGASDYLTVTNGTTTPVLTVVTGIADTNVVRVDGTANNAEYAKFTANGLEGRTFAEVRTDLNVADGADVGTVTNVSSATTNQLTVANGTSTPALTIVTAAVANGETGLATGDQIYDFVIAQGYTTNDGTVTNVTTTTANQLTIANGTTTPALSIITAAVANGETGLATGDQIYDFVVAQGYIDGSGTANRLARFTDADTIDDGLTRDNGSEVAIGGSLDSDRLLNLFTNSHYYGVNLLNQDNTGDGSGDVFGFRSIISGSPGGDNVAFYANASGASGVDYSLYATSGYVYVADLDNYTTSSSDTLVLVSDGGLFKTRTIGNLVADGGGGGGGGGVTSVGSGNGMNFTTITGAGTVTLGTPSTLTSATSNALTSNSHTHEITTGISNTNIVKIDSASVADNEYARFTASGLESRSAAEVLSDISAAPDTLTTNGDILYYNAGYQRLAAGTNGFMLYMTAGVPTWAAAPSGTGDVTSSGMTSGYVPYATGAKNIENSALRADASNVAIGQAPSSDTMLRINATSDTYGVFISNTGAYSLYVDDGDIRLEDNIRLELGTGGDVQVYYDGASGLEIRNSADSQIAYFYDTGALSLNSYLLAAGRLETTSYLKIHEQSSPGQAASETGYIFMDTVGNLCYTNDQGTTVRTLSYSTP